MNVALVLAGCACFFPPQGPLDVSLRGTVVDGKDRPIAGARVNIAMAGPRACRKPAPD